jgi:hypothetical protein
MLCFMDREFKGEIRLKITPPNPHPHTCSSNVKLARDLHVNFVVGAEKHASTRENFSDGWKKLVLFLSTSVRKKEREKLVTIRRNSMENLDSKKEMSEVFKMRKISAKVEIFSSRQQKIIFICL